MIRTPLLLALAALALVQCARALRPLQVDLSTLAADAPAWLAELTDRDA